MSLHEKSVRLASDIAPISEESHLDISQNFYFKRYIPNKRIDPISLLPSYGLDWGSEKANKFQFERRYGPQNIYEDEPHARGTRAVEIGIDAVRESGIIPDVIVVVTSHIPDENKMAVENPQRIANVLRRSLVNEDLIPDIEATPENTHTVVAACSGLAVALAVIKEMDILNGKNVMIVADETNYRETIHDPSEDDGKAGMLFSETAVVGIIKNINKNFRVLSASGIYYGDDSQMLEMRVARVDASDPFITAYNPPYADNFEMDGPELLKFFAREITEKDFYALLSDGETTREQLKFFFCHQASSRMTQFFNEMFSEVPVKSEGIKKYGNTSSVSAWLALEDAVKAGKLQKGDKGLILGFGGGLAWAAAVVEL